MFRRALAAATMLLLVVLPFASVQPASAQTVTCADFDAWQWAQSVLDSDPDLYAASLDPDGNGLACESLTVNGFGPTLWTDAIPANAEAAQVVSVTDGDTFKVTVNGAEDSIRMYHIDTPETVDPNVPQQCGAAEATNYLSYVLGLVPNGTVYLEYDQTQRDQYDRRLAYVWFELGGDVYMVNEVMVRGGWAESDTFRPDEKYKEQLDAAEQFSVQHVTGVRLQCGKFNQALGSTPSNEQVRQAMFAQPNQGQFDAYLNPVPAQATTAQAPAVAADQPVSQEPVYQEPAVVEQPAYQEPVYEEPAVVEQPATGGCDPNYTPCVPQVAYDLDCGDIGFSVTVIGYDVHGFDREGDGLGCESY
jgi:endonuclease YncB( thermonuclease family)